jgi:hypothetical protein
MATVKEQVGEALLGTTQEPQLSQQTKAIFMKHAVKDEQTGEYYLGENEFIDAVAPESEDYVICPDGPPREAITDQTPPLAQNQTEPVWDPLPRGRPSADGKSDPT